MRPPSFLARTLTDLVLHRSCEDNHSCCELLYVANLSCPEDPISHLSSQHQPLPPFPAPLPQWSLGTGTWGCGLLNCGRAIPWYSFSKLWPDVTFGIDTTQNMPLWWSLRAIPVYEQKAMDLEGSLMRHQLTVTVVGSTPEAYELLSHGLLARFTVPEVSFLLKCRPLFKSESGLLSSSCLGHDCTHGHILLFRF